MAEPLDPGIPLLIPRIFHQVWLGPRPLPEEARAFQRTWRRCHPGWDWRLWTDADLPGLRSQEALARSHHLAMKSDVVRYEALERHGGVYVDTDFECRRCLEPLLGGVAAFAAWQSPGVLCNALLGAAPGHPLLRRLVDGLPESFRQYSTNVDIAGPGYFTRTAEAVPGVTLFDAALFYPYLWYETHRRGEPFPDAYAVHHWSGSWA